MSKINPKSSRSSALNALLISLPSPNTHLYLSNPTHFSRDSSNTFLWNFPPTPPIRVSHYLLLLAIIVCRNFMSSLSLSHVIKSLGRERCFLPHLSYYLYPNAVHILGPWSGLGYAQFSKIEIWLTYNIMFISGVVHSDLTFAYIVKLLWH